MTRTFQTITEEEEKSSNEHDGSEFRRCKDESDYGGSKDDGESEVFTELRGDTGPFDQVTITLARSNAASLSSTKPGRFTSSSSDTSFVTSRTSSYASYRTALSFSHPALPIRVMGPLSASSKLGSFPVEKLREIVSREQAIGQSTWQTTANHYDVLANKIALKFEEMHWCEEMPPRSTMKVLFLDSCHRLLSDDNISVASIITGAQESVVSFCDLCNLRSKPEANLEAFQGALSGLIMNCLCDVLYLGYLAKDLESFFDRNGRWPSRGKRPQVSSSSWLEHLKSRGLIVDRSFEHNWSGRGQHVEYDQRSESDIPLSVERVLGYSASAIVESVMCRRLRLARKKIRCTRQLTKSDYVTEVEHLQRLQYAHIVRVVGTYTFRKDLAILLYPVATWNLDEFMEDMVYTTSNINRDVLTSGT